MIIKKGIYKGWSLLTAIKDIYNRNKHFSRLNIYPDWFKEQFNHSKQK